ncbi:capsid protein precursor [Caprine astrovirus G5.1]|nr:capsid protein precursor [Caprine astrovirus G5.1]
MASNNTRRTARNTTNIVVRNGPAAPQGAAAPNRGQGRRRGVQRRARRQQRAQVMVRVQPNQTSRRGRIPRRPRINNRVVFQKITTTLGTVGSNGSEQIECELTCLMNPATMKEATGSNSFGPLGIYASTYSLFRMTKCVVKLKPLVGDSAVSGTITRVSWNPTSAPTQTSWSALGARKHIDVTPGKIGIFTLTARDLVGPKGGWYKTNTKGDPMMSFAGTLECHTLGRTMSTYRNEAFTGGLFLAELETEWQFKDYAQQPGMVNLLKGEDTTQAQIVTSSDGKIQLQLPANSRMARAATTTASEIIWLVTDTIINAGASAFPPPFNWLFRGGWWLVKRAAGAPVRAGEVTFDVYSSISDARAGVPCISTTPSSPPVSIGGLHFQQVTPGNVGIGDDIVRESRSIDIQPVSSPPRVLAYSGMYDTTFIPGYHVLYEKNNVPRSERGLAVPVQEGYITTYNYGKVEVDARPPPTRGIPVYLATSNTNRTQIGLAVSSTSTTLDNGGTPITLSTMLFYCTESRNYDFTQSNDGLFRVADLSYSQAQAQIILRTRTVNKRKVLVASGSWYVLQFFCYGAAHETYRVDTPMTTEIRTPQNAWPASETTITYTPDSGNAEAGLTPGYSTSILLGDIQTYTVTRYTRAMVDEEYHDLPPLEDEDDADDEDEDLTDEQLEMGPFDDYDTPPMSRLVVHPDARKTYELLLELYSERDARLAVNQLKPSDEYKEFVALYHDALVDGLSPRSARAHALGI